MNAKELLLKCKELHDNDIIGDSVFLSVCELLSSYVLKSFPLLESQVVEVVDKLLTEIEQERVISDLCMSEK